MIIVLDEVLVNCDFEISDAPEYAPTNALSRDFSEETFDEIEPGRRGWNKMHVKARMSLQPFDYVRMLVGGVVVGDQMEIKVRRRVLVNGSQELDELLVPVPIQTATDDGAVEQVQGRKQGRGAIALVVVGHGSRPALFQRQPRLGSIERLNLALLVHRQHQRLVRRIEVKSDDIDQLLLEFWIVRQLERPEQMRFEPMSPPDFLNAADRDPDRLRHSTGAPVRRVSWAFGRRLGHHLSDHRRRQRLLSRQASLVPQQAVYTRFAEPGLPAPDRRFRLARPPHDLHRADTIGRQQNDLGTPSMLLRGVPVRDQGVQPSPILRRKLNRNASSHAPRLAQREPKGNPLFRSKH